MWHIFKSTEVGECMDTGGLAQEDWPHVWLNMFFSCDCSSL